MKEKRMHIVQLGDTSGFPYGMAAIEKMKLLGKGLLDAGIDVTIVCKKGSFDPDNPIELPPAGQHQGMNYVYTTGSIYRPKGFLARNLKKLQGWYEEIKLLKKFKREQGLDAAIVHSMNGFTMIFYKILAKIFGFQYLYPYVELNSSLPQRSNLKYRIIDFVQENYSLKLPDGILPISDLLISFVKKKAPGVPYLKVPIICDYAKFEVEKVVNKEKYFLYCGAANYYEVIFFILEAFDQLKNEDYQLYLVIGGDEPDKERVKNHIQSLDNKDKIKWFSGIPYEDLVQKYLNAKGLLIPLRKTIQDEARFPHKIGEYLASGNPMITTHAGEIKHYFKDQEQALVAENFDAKVYKEKMQFVIDHPEEARKIGLKGKEFGKNNFDHPVFGQKIKTFLQHINEN